MNAYVRAANARLIEARVEHTTLHTTHDDAITQRLIGYRRITVQSYPFSSHISDTSQISGHNASIIQINDFNDFQIQYLLYNALFSHPDKPDERLYEPQEFHLP